MGILKSFNIGISGLSSTGQGIDIIADNIANAGTTGYKASRGEFQDILAGSLKGVDGGKQLGAGTMLSHSKKIMTQGEMTRTESMTDLAIDGDGFFRVQAPFGVAYTRDGSLHFNKNGELVNNDDYKIMGFIPDSNGKISHNLSSIKLNKLVMPAKGTTMVEMDMNFDSRVKILKFDITKPDKTSNFNNSITVYDSVGNARILSIFFNKENNDSWTYRVMANGKDSVGGEDGMFTEMHNGNVKFNKKGILLNEQVNQNSFNFNKGAELQQKINFNFGNSLAEGGDGLSGSTHYGTQTFLKKQTQNGSNASSLSSMSFDNKGILTAVYNNGELRPIAQVAIAKFENNEGLFKIGKNLLRESKRSGQAVMGGSGELGRGMLLSKSIELSNVDMANEFVQLMTAQRNFQANAKILTTADEMLKEVLNIKR